MKAIILISEASLPLAKTLQRELPDTLIYTKNECEGCISITSCHRFIEEHFNDFDSIIFIGAMGICVRSIAGCIKNKYKDPAVVCVDSTGRFVISVLSGHVGGANELTRHIAAITGGEAVITTQSDNAGLWALDTLAGKYGWKITVPHAKMNRLVTLFVNREPTALLLDIKDKGTEYLERTLPAHVKVTCTVTICKISSSHDEAWLLSVYGGCRTHRFYEYGKHHDHEYYDKKAGIWCITGCGYDK